MLQSTAPGDSCPGPCGSSEPPHKEGRTKYTAGTTIRVSKTAREGVWQVQSHGEKQLSVLPPTPSGQRPFKPRPPLLQMHFFTHSINTSFHLLTTGCLPCTVQFWGSSFCPSGGRQTITQGISIQYVRCWKML